MRKTKTTYQRATRKTRKNLPTQSGEGKIRRGRQEQTPAASRTGFGFYPVVPSSFIAADKMDQERYRDLYDTVLASYNNYCRVSGAHAYVDTNLSLARQIDSMVKHLKVMIKAVSKDARLDVIKVKDEYKIVAYEFVFKNQTLFIFPMQLFEIIRMYDEGFSKMFFLYMTNVLKKLGFTMCYDNDRFDYLYSSEFVQDQLDEDADEDIKEDYFRTMHNYQSFGRVYRDKMKSVVSGFDNPILVKDFYVNKPTAERLNGLHSWMIDGIEIMQDPACKGIHQMQFDLEMHIEYNDYNSEYGDAVNLDNCFIISWDDDDLLSRQYLDWLNNDAEEFGSYSPMNWHLIDEKTDSPFTSDAWSINMFAWLERGFTIFDSLKLKHHG